MKKNLKGVAIAIGVGTIVKSVCNLLSNNETIQKGLDSIKKERIEDKKMKEMNKRYNQQIRLDSSFKRYKKAEMVQWILRQEKKDLKEKQQKSNKMKAKDSE